MMYARWCPMPMRRYLNIYAATIAAISVRQEQEKKTLPNAAAKEKPIAGCRRQSGKTPKLPSERGPKCTGIKATAEAKRELAADAVTPEYERRPQQARCLAAAGKDRAATPAEKAA